jgi:hypothetical protein
MVATTGCDLVFADPDSGTRTALHPAPAHRTKAVKHAYLSELAPFAQRGQSLLIYHHGDRTATIEQQAHRRLAGFARQVPVKPIAAVRASRHESAVPGRCRFGIARPLPDGKNHRS